MATATLPAPGTKLGPCEPGCEHIDCGETRRMAVEVCRFCGKPIGYERRFYADPPPAVRAGALVHASCLEDSIGRP